MGIEVIKKIPKEIRYILLFFIISRVILTFIGVFTRIIQNYKTGEIVWLNIWSNWDSGWYLNIAQNWYTFENSNPLKQSNIGFFPFYPFLVRILGILFNNYILSGIIVSNICLIIACIFLYKLVLLEGEEKTALKSIKYLFLFPVAFLFSGILSESLFILLLLMCFYYAKKENWMIVGISGFFLALTRPFGVLMILPLGYMYLKSKKFKFKNLRYDLLYLFLIPIAVILFFLYGYHITGDFLAYSHSKFYGWGNYLSNPLYNLFYMIFLSKDILFILIGTYIFSLFSILCIFYKKINFAYWLSGMLLLLFPLSYGVYSAPYGFFRYSVLIFPLYIIFAKLGKNRVVDISLTILLVLLQAILMSLWVTGSRLIM